MARQVTAQDVHLILNAHEAELAKLFANVSPVHLSRPPDGRGIKVSVLPSLKDKVPRIIEFELNGEQIVIPLRAEEDYQEYNPYNDN